MAETELVWWTIVGGWERYGRHTPMRRCGFCKADLLSDPKANMNRGCCASCDRRHIDPAELAHLSTHKPGSEALLSDHDPGEDYDMAEGFR